MEPQEQNFNNNFPLKKTVAYNDNFLVILLSILLVLASSIGVFFGWQARSLSRELQETKVSLKSQSVKINDNLQTYVSNNLGISIQFPNNLVVVDNCLEENKICGLTLGLEETGGLFFEIHKIFNTTIEKEFENDSKQYSTFLQDKNDKPTLKNTVLDFKEAKYTIFKNASMGTDIKSIYIQISDDVIKIYLPAYEYSPANQIISTFKFIKPETTSSSLPIACTMDAKICPDGSAVGRSGPKCEFDPCPTPKSVSTSPLP